MPSPPTLGESSAPDPEGGIEELRQRIERLAGVPVGREVVLAAMASVVNASTMSQTLSLQGSPDHVPAPSVSADPAEVAGYKILSRIAAGGMGVVYQARQPGLQRLVALKMMRRALGAESEEMERFRREAAAVARLQHPHIVQIYEVGQHEEQPFFSMEFVEGGSLAQRLDGAPWPAVRAARLVAEAADAMGFAHARQIVHRDLKPGNILLAKRPGTSDSSSVDDALERRRDEPTNARPPNEGDWQAGDWMVKIADFGLARRLGSTDQTLTLADAIVGTPSYMPPEQASGHREDVGPAADIYALGAVLYELLTGRPPFKGTTALETLAQVRTREPVAPRQLNPAAPRDLETICLKCLAKDPRQRYDTAGALAADLGRFIRGEPVLARPVGLAQRAWRWSQRQPVVAGLSATVVVTLLLATAISTSLAVAERIAAERAQWHADQASLQAGIATTKTGEALAAMEKERTARMIAERESRRATAMRLAAQARDVAPSAPERGVLLALEAIEATRRAGEPVLPHAHQALRDTLANIGGTPLRGPENMVFALAVSPDGRWLLSSHIRALCVWNTHTHQLHECVSIPASGFTSAVAVGPDGGQVAVAGTRNSEFYVDTWKFSPEGRLEDRRSLPKVLGKVICLEFSANGRWLIGQIELNAGGLAIWNPHEPDTARQLVQTTYARNYSLSADGNRLAVVSPLPGSPSQLWSLAGDQPELTDEPPFREGVLSYSRSGNGLAFAPTHPPALILADETGQQQIANIPSALRSPQSGLAAFAKGFVTFGANQIVVYERASAGSPEAWQATAYEAHASRIHHLAVSASSGWIATANLDHTICLWPPHRKPFESQPAPLLRGHADEITSLEFSPDESRLFSGSRDGVIRVWRLTPPRFRAGMIELPTPAGQVRFSPDGRWLAANGAAGLYQLGEQPEFVSFAAAGHQPAVVGFLRDNRWFVGANAYEVTRTGLADRSILATERYQRGPRASAYRRLELSATGRYAIGWLPRQGLDVWDMELQPPAICCRVDQDLQENAQIFCHHDRYLAISLARDNRLAIYDVEGNRPEAREIAQAISWAGSGAQSLNGRWLVTGAVDFAGGLVWDLDAIEHGQQATPITLSGGDRSWFGAISSDGALVAAGENQGVVAVWDLRSPDGASQPRRFSTGRPGRYWKLAFSPDGQTLAAAGNHDLLHLWDLAADADASPVSIAIARDLRGLEFSPDGRWVAAYGDESIQLWPLWLAELEAEAHFVVGRLLTPTERQQFDLPPAQ